VGGALTRCKCAQQTFNSSTGVEAADMRRHLPDIALAFAVCATAAVIGTLIAKFSVWS
jgi:hypothetical protein